MKKITIEVEDTPYQVLVADTEESRIKGLQGVTHMPKNKGMLFKWDEPGKRDFWMKDTLIPLLQAFLNEDMEVVKVLKRQPLDETLMGFDGIQYVLELNADEDVKEGDEITIDDGKDLPTMKVLAPDGSEQYQLQGGERIFSRANTISLIKWSKKAFSSKEDKDYKRLGKMMFKFLYTQNTNKPEYVQLDK